MANENDATYCEIMNANYLRFENFSTVNVDSIKTDSEADTVLYKNKYNINGTRVC